MQREKGRRNGSLEGLSVDGTFVGGSDLSMSPGLNYIEHRVSKMDTLAGIAIKYGVEVADIKRMNGLMTDFQMFAHKTLKIPLPGRHPPSTIISNDSASSEDQSTEQTPNRRPLIDDILDSFQPLKLNPKPPRVSPAMSSLQNYYGLVPPSNGKPKAEGMEMAVYRSVQTQDLDDDDDSSRGSLSEPPLGRHRKTRSLVNGFLPENGNLFEDILSAETVQSESDRLNEMSVRRRQKADVNPASQTELLLKEESGSVFSGITGKGLALRPKSASRAQLAEADTGRVNPTPTAEPLTGDVFSGVRKSSSTSNLQESDNGSSIWPTSKWSIKPDLQALSAASIARPIFDGLPKPITGRRKAALD